jgi:cell division protein FtsA
VIGAKQKELGAALINIGASTTSLAIFEEGELLHTAVIPIGSEHITADVAIGLRCPINLAERIKKEHGSAQPDKFGKKDEIDITELVKEEGAQDELKTVSRKYLSEIIEARVEEIFTKVDQEFKKIERSGMLPGGVYLIGGGTRLQDIVEVAKKQLRLPACIGINKTVPTIIDKVNEPEMLNALGLVIWGSAASSGNSGGKINIPGGQMVDKTWQQVKKWFSALIP